MDLTARRQDAPERRSASVAQHGVVAAGEHSGHPAPALSQALVADGVHAAVDAMKAPCADATLNRRRAEADGDQLGMSDHAMLPRGNHRDPEIDGVRLLLRSHSDCKCRRTENSPPGRPRTDREFAPGALIAMA